jgi:hypothetical protein
MRNTDPSDEATMVRLRELLMARGWPGDHGLDEGIPACLRQEWENMATMMVVITPSTVLPLLIEVPILYAFVNDELLAPLGDYSPAEGVAVEEAFQRFLRWLVAALFEEVCARPETFTEDERKFVWGACPHPISWEQETPIYEIGFRHRDSLCLWPPT